MQDWRRSGRIGTRERREAHNASQAENRGVQRGLILLEGGKPDATHRGGKPRRGSRKRGKDGELATEEDSNLQNKGLGDSDKTGASQEPVQAGEMQHIATPLTEVSGQAAPEPPHRWSEADFTPAALAESDRKFGPKDRPSSRELLDARRDLADTLSRTHGLSGPKDRGRKIDAGGRGRLPNSLLRPQKK